MSTNTLLFLVLMIGLLMFGFGQFVSDLMWLDTVEHMQARVYE